MINKIGNGKKIQKIGILPNMDKDGWREYTLNVVKWLVDKAVQPCISRETGESMNMGMYSLETDELYSQSDFIIVLGGDGTLLSASRNCAVYNTPLLGINLGTLGYLTDVEKKDGFDALEKALDGRCKLEKRMMLEANILNQNESGEAFIALNDIIVSKGILSKMIELALYINNEYIDTFRADGVIISTPTGSTAYNLSAGGPILKPDAEMIAITPICPHALHIRSWVVSADDIISLKIAETYSNECILSMDGQNRIQVVNGDSVNVKKSLNYTTIIKTSGLNFYDILRMKMVHAGCETV